MDTSMRIPHTIPDTTSRESDAVTEVLKSGWITTGPKTKEFERAIAAFCGTSRAACVNSASAALTCALRLLGVGPGDEVITSAYTYTASCSVITHVGATPVLVDTAPGSYEMDYDALEAAVTERTKVIIPVDVGGVMCDYDAILRLVARTQALFHPATPLQEQIGRIIVLADAAHSLGADYHGQRSGSVADFTAFSFHAVKNITTAEGGALTWRSLGADTDDDIYRRMMLLSLHGQSSDALAKSRLGAWEYDIVELGYKCNMTDVAAAQGLVQLDRYPAMLRRRHAIMDAYTEGLADIPVEMVAHDDARGTSSAHLALTQLSGRDEGFRNRFIMKMGERGIACNVHYKPLPLFTAYRQLGFDIAEYPQAFAQYRGEVTLPLYSTMSDEQVAYVLDCFHDVYGGLDAGE